MKKKQNSRKSQRNRARSKFTRNKRKVTQEKFYRRLPYFNMFEKDKNDENKNN
jgi:hypothetical protein